MLAYPGIAQTLNDAIPAQVSATYASGDGAVGYSVLVVSLGMTYALLNANCKFGKSTTVSDAFTKSRTVAAGVRILKTSSAEAESGQLDFVYSRDGTSFDESAPIGFELGRPRTDRSRCYIAGNPTGACRGRTGLVAQVNYRPADEQSFSMIDVGEAHASDTGFMEIAGRTGAIWFCFLHTTSNSAGYQPGDYQLFTIISF